MPLGDGTGPNGMGPRTGRGMGFCAGFNQPGFANGFGRGFGRGFAFRTRQTFPEERPQLQVIKTEEQEKQFLEKELENLKQEIKEIEERLEKIKK